MPDTKQLLRETRDRVAPPNDVLGGLERRRRHKMDVKRASAAVVGITVALIGLGGWLLLERDDTPTPLGRPTSTPTLAPAGPSALAFGVDGDVFVAGADGSNPVKIADGVPLDGADECAPGEERAEYGVFGTAWSPDGRYLAYWDWGCPVPSGAWGTVRISDAAGNPVASFPGQGWQISWSPDSTRIAVMDSWAQGAATIGVHGIDGARQASLSVPASMTPSGDYSPVWSRDGSSILLPGVQVPLDGGAPTSIPGAYGAYSPDGSRFASKLRSGLVVEDVTAVPDAQKMSGTWEFWNVAWSPDGGLVAYEAGDRELVVRDVATGADTSLVTVQRPESLGVLEFSADGERVLFRRSVPDGTTSLWSIGVDGSDPRRLLADTDWVDLRP